jgi:hypothetical protein
MAGAHLLVGIRCHDVLTIPGDPIGRRNVLTGETHGQEASLGKMLAAGDRRGPHQTHQGSKMEVSENGLKSHGFGDPFLGNLHFFLVLTSNYTSRVLTTHFIKLHRKVLDFLSPGLFFQV